MQTSILFWDVDTQADFIHADGKLYVPGAEKIVPNLKRLTDWASQNSVLIVASACAHQPGDAEFMEYPPHCLVGTPGQSKIDETRLPSVLVIPSQRMALPQPLPERGQVVLEKQHFDVFSNPNTEVLLSQIGKKCDVILYGVVTEICVACAGRGLLARGHRVQVVTDAVRHLEQDKAQAFFEETNTAGGALVTTDEVLRSLSHHLVA